MDIRFGTSGIRGLIDEEISESLCWRVGTALALYFGEGSKLVIAYDTRPGAERLAGICAAAMKNVGAEVINLGIAPSPYACAAILTKGLKGGLMVTGSHMPYDRIGLIPLDEMGAIPPRAETNKLGQMVKEIPEPLEITSLLPEPENFDYDFLMFSQEIIESQLPGKGIKVALDTGGATGAGIISRLMNDLGCDVKAIHDQPMDFAPRRMEPRIDSIDELIELVLNTGADFGAAFDSDCDRILFVDEKGKPVSEDLAAVIFAEYLYAEQGGDIVTPVNSSGLIKKIWQGQVIDCIIGPPEISLAAIQNNAVFAYEESGKYFFPPRVMWADGLIATAFMAKILSTSGKTLSTIISEFPRHVQIKRNIKGTWQQMDKLLARIKQGFHPPGAKLNDIDGLKYVFQDGSWLLIRPSGTEPLMRIYVDSPSPTRARELSELGLNTVKRLIEE